MCALRYQNRFDTHDRVPNYYVNNRLYPRAYQRTDWPTRTSRRMHDGLNIDRNYGLDTTSDDLNSSPYSSPYYINGRYNSSNLTTQTGNSASVQGTTRLLTLHDEVEDFTEADIQTTIKLWQGKQIKFTLPYSGKVVGNTIELRNTDACQGVLSIYFSATDGGPTIYETAIDLCTVSRDNFEHRKLYAMTPFPAHAAPRGELYVRMEIWDEIDCERSENPFNTGRYIEIAATGIGNHQECINLLGEKNMPVDEVYTYTPQLSRPCIGLIYNNWTSVPTNRVEGVDYGAVATQNGYTYHIYCIKNTTEAEAVIYDPNTNTVVESNIRVDGRVEALNLVQAGGWVYYVDGYSPVQKFQVGVWNSQVVSSQVSPVEGASIITFHHNRIYLAGFRNDPNLVQFTEITEQGPVYDNFAYRFYSPGQSPADTSTDPITAIVEYESDRLMIATTGGFSLYASNVDVENTTPTQVSLYSDGGGVASEGDIVSYRGIIYSFDPDEGIRRFTGSIWSKIPAALDSHIERVDMTKPRKLWGYAYKLYFNYTDAVDGKAKCMIWDMAMNYQQYPWFQDSDLPFCDVRADNDFDLTGIHPDYPCIMKLYAQDTWRRLDTPITFRRDTKYISLPGNASDMILKRIHNKVIANANRWWLFGISYDADNLTPDRGVQAWYRIPAWATQEIPTTVENPFYDEDVYEENATVLLSLPNLWIRAISVQERIMCRTFRAQANLISTLFEAGVRNYN